MKLFQVLTDRISESKSKRGSAVAEAALIYPLVIIISVVMLTSAVFYYEVCSAYCAMDKDMRREAGIEKGTVLYPKATEITDDGPYELSEDGLVMKNITGTLEMTFKGGFSLKRDDGTVTKFTRNELNEIDAVIAKQKVKGLFDGT